MGGVRQGKNARGLLCGCECNPPSHTVSSSAASPTRQARSGTTARPVQVPTGEPCVQHTAWWEGNGLGVSCLSSDPRAVPAGGGGQIAWRLRGDTGLWMNRGSPGGQRAPCDFPRDPVSNPQRPCSFPKPICPTRVSVTGCQAPPPACSRPPSSQAASLSPACRLNQFPAPRRGVPWAPRDRGHTCAA